MRAVQCNLKFRIERLGSPQEPCWRQLWSQYQAFYRTELPASATQATWQRILDGRIRVGAVDTSDRLAGIVHFLFHEDTWSTKPACYLQDLYVVEEFRGRGCARQLIDHAAESAQAAGAAPPYWLTHETNSTARKLYDTIGDNLGFIQYVYKARP